MSIVTSMDSEMGALADVNDQASQQESAERAMALSKIQQAIEDKKNTYFKYLKDNPEHDPDYCLLCGDDVPLLRKQNHSLHCTICAQNIENRSKRYSH